MLKDLDRVFAENNATLIEVMTKKEQYLDLMIMSRLVGIILFYPEIVCARSGDLRDQEGTLTLPSPLVRERD